MVFQTPLLVMSKVLSDNHGCNDLPGSVLSSAEVSGDFMSKFTSLVTVRVWTCPPPPVTVYQTFFFMLNSTEHENYDISILNDTSNVTDSVFAIFQKRLEQLNRTFHL